MMMQKEDTIARKLSELINHRFNESEAFESNEGSTSTCARSHSFSWDLNNNTFAAVQTNEKITGIYNSMGTPLF